MRRAHRNNRQRDTITNIDLDRLASAVVPEEEHWLKMEHIPESYRELAECLMRGMPPALIARLMGVSHETYRQRMAFLGSWILALRRAAGDDPTVRVPMLAPANRPPSRRELVSSSPFICG